MAFPLVTINSSCGSMNNRHTSIFHYSDTLIYLITHSIIQLSIVVGKKAYSIGRDWKKHCRHFCCPRLETATPERAFLRLRLRGKDSAVTGSKLICIAAYGLLLGVQNDCINC